MVVVGRQARESVFRAASIEELIPQSHPGKTLLFASQREGCPMWMIIQPALQLNVGNPNRFINLPIAQSPANGGST
jgi:hypothetical protein